MAFPSVTWEPRGSGTGSPIPSPVNLDGDLPREGLADSCKSNQERKAVVLAICLGHEEFDSEIPEQASDGAEAVGVPIPSAQTRAKLSPQGHL